MDRRRAAPRSRAGRAAAGRPAAGRTRRAARACSEGSRLGSALVAVDLRALIREIPDFPKPGIGFKDITPVLADPAGLDAAVTALAEQARPLGVDVVIGADARELHSDAVSSGARVLVHDDLLATGGTARALCQLVEQLSGTVAGCQFLIELTFLNGREALAGYDVHSLITYDEPE